MYFLDENNKELGITQKGNSILINNNDHYWEINNITIPKSYPGVTIATHWGWGRINFIFTENGVKILGSGGRITTPIKADRIEALDEYNRFMSDRGYIWSRSLSMAKDYILTGAGADNFPIVFPQDDYLAKLNTLNDASLVIDKPHNMYLQTTINTGLITLIALFLLAIMYLFESIKIYSKAKFDSLEKFVGASCLVSVTGYLVAGLFNDNIVSVYPLFWIILGIGININYRLSKHM